MLSALLGAALVVSGPAWAEGPDASAAIGRQIAPSIVKLSAFDALGRPTATGSGFFVSEGGRIVTNAHVWRTGPTEATLADGQTVAVVGMLAADDDVDLAVLQVEGGPYPALPLGDEASLGLGDPLVVVSAPFGLAQSFADGRVSSVRPDGVEDREQFPTAPLGATVQFSAGAVAPGSSGSAVVDGDGRVIGVTQSGVVLSDVRFAVAVSEVRAMLDAIEPDAVPVPAATVRRDRLVRAAAGPVLVVLLALGLPPLWRRLRPRPADPSPSKPRARRGWDA